MGRSYYTFRIRITNRHDVRVEVHYPDNRPSDEPSGKFRYQGGTQKRIKELHDLARNGELRSLEVKELGKKLFDAMFDEGLRRHFFELHKEVGEDALLRLELDVDEHELPDIAALPWEFMRTPSNASDGNVWLGTAPNLIFSRRRARWRAAKPIQLEPDEPLRIAIAVANPKNGDLSPVKFDKVLEALNKLAKEQPKRIELLELVNPATTVSIDKVLETKKPHIFHFIGHGRLRDENQRDTGQIALIDAALDGLDKPDWIDAERFGELLNRHQPAVVVLQACEGAALSASEAFAGLASRVVDHNIPVVVAMQYEVSNSTAQQFVLEFYRRLSENDPVDKAAQEGRRQISLVKGYETRDFATPVLFMSVQDGYLFKRSAPSVRDESHSVGKGLIALSEMMDSPEVRNSVVAYQTNFDAALEQIRILGDYKDMHDKLHDFQYLCYNSIVQETKRLPDEDALNNLRYHEHSFQDFVRRFGEIAGRASFDVNENSWVQDLAQAREELDRAIDDANLQQMGDAVLLMKRVLAIHPSRINNRLKDAARALRMPALVKAMEFVLSQLTSADRDPENLEKVRQFETSVDDLKSLSRRLTTLIEEHDLWQQVDDELRLHAFMGPEDMSNLKWNWPSLKKKVEHLCSDSEEEWAKSVKADGEKLETSMFVKADGEELEASINSQDLRKVKYCFQNYHRLASQRFYDVDKNLRNLCDNLRDVGDALEALCRTR